MERVLAMTIPHSLPRDFNVSVLFVYRHVTMTTANRHTRHTREIVQCMQSPFDRFVFTSFQRENEWWSCAQSRSVKYRRSSILFHSSSIRLDVVHSHRMWIQFNVFVFLRFFAMFMFAVWRGYFRFNWPFVQWNSMLLWFFLFILRVYSFTLPLDFAKTRRLLPVCVIVPTCNQNITLALAKNSSLMYFCPFQIHHRYVAKFRSVSSE